MELPLKNVVDFMKGKKPIDGLLKKLKIMLLSVNPVLNDAEEKQLTKPGVKEWLDELKEATFDADYLVDDINTEALTCKLEADQSRGSTSQQVLKLISTLFSGFDKIIESKIVEVLDRPYKTF